MPKKLSYTSFPISCPGPYAKALATNPDPGIGAKDPTANAAPDAIIPPAVPATALAGSSPCAISSPVNAVPVNAGIPKPFTIFPAPPTNPLTAPPNPPPGGFTPPGGLLGVTKPLITLKGVATVLPNNLAIPDVILDNEDFIILNPNFIVSSTPAAIPRFFIILFLISPNLLLFPSPSALIYSITLFVNHPPKRYPRD